MVTLSTLLLAVFPPAAANETMVAGMTSRVYTVNHNQVHFRRSTHIIHGQRRIRHILAVHRCGEAHCCAGAESCLQCSRSTREARVCDTYTYTIDSGYAPRGGHS